MAKTKETQLRKSAKVYSEFTGYNAEIVGRMRKPVVPDVLTFLGTIDALAYTTKRAGKVEHYQHEFSGGAKPMFCVSPDGKQIFLIGGKYKFGRRGIVDKKGRRA